MARFLAFYLPQYYPTKENNEWWGAGFTEWVNVARARPLYRGHVQPHIPADLGFYDLRVEETRIKQAELAREAGIEGFCYYHYWFGNGKLLLEKPFQSVLKSGKPDYPFCLCWANHSWYKKLWDPKAPGKDRLLISQEYPGEEDYIAHFNYLLPAFKDSRYIKVDNKILFLIYDPIHFADIKNFITTWRRLAADNGLNDFYFVGTDFDSRNKDMILSAGVDAIYNHDTFNIHHHLTIFGKAFHYCEREFFHRPTVFKYKDAIDYMISDDCINNNVIPMIVPNWDHSPRSGHHAIILHGSTPQLFAKLIRRALKIVANKPPQHQIIMIKSWNEWGEGNYLEPDLEYGHSYLEVLKQEINRNNVFG